MDNLPTTIGTKKTFEDIKHVSDSNIEFWYARELMNTLDYDVWRNFEKVINKAIIACISSKTDPNNHFVDVDNMASNREQGGGVQQKNYILSRYACYLIAQNGDSSKQAIADAQTYFAIQTRKQEIFENLTEEEQRVYTRNQLREYNKQLNDSAYNAGVREMGKFHNYGYQGLYGYGMTVTKIKEKKGIKGELSDHMGATELAANLFRVTQTNEKLKKDNIQEEIKANKTHMEVGRIVRNAIKEAGGTMPENLEPEENIKVLEKKLKQKRQQAVLKNKTKELPQIDADLGLFEKIEDKALNI